MAYGLGFAVSGFEISGFGVYGSRDLGVEILEGCLLLNLPRKKLNFKLLD